MKKALLALAVALSASGLTAEDWAPIGAKGLGMAGAQVANPEGSQAILVNPAALGKKDMNRADLALPLTVTVGSAGGLIENADSLYKKFDDTSATGVQASLDRLGGTSNAATIGSDIKAVSDFLTIDAKVLDKPGQGISVGAAGALTARWGKVGIAVGSRLYAAGTVKYDNNFSFSSTGTTSFLTTQAAQDIKAPVNTLTIVGSTAIQQSNLAAVRAQMNTSNDDTNANHLTIDQINYYANPNASIPGEPDALLTADEITFRASLVDEANQVNNLDKQPSTGATTTTLDNATGVEVRALWTKEVSLAYGFSFADDTLHVAPAVKLIQGETRFSAVRLVDDTDTDLGDELTEDKNSKSTTAIGVDLGILYHPHPKWSLGLVAKDLNSPSFDLSNGQQVELKPAIRVGAAYEYTQKPGWRGLIAFDADALKNESTLLIGHDSQQIAIGVSQELMGFLSLRVGANKDLASEGEGVSYSAGLGIQLHRFYIDLAGMLATDEVTIDGDDYPTRGGAGITLGWNQNF